MSGFNCGALTAGVVSIGSTVSLVSGHPALAAIFSDPSTASALTGILAGLGTLYSVFSPALLHSTTTAAAASIATTSNGK